MCVYAIESVIGRSECCAPTGENRKSEARSEIQPWSCPGRLKKKKNTFIVWRW